jgi:hypothetical protein
MEIRYRNFKGIYITKQQLGTLYDKEYYLNGILKKTESIVNGKIQNVLYFKENEETDLSILAQYGGPELTCVTIKFKSPNYLSYSVYKYEFWYYKKATGLFEKATFSDTSLYLPNGFYLCTERIDSEYNPSDTRYKRISKICYLNYVNDYENDYMCSVIEEGVFQYMEKVENNGDGEDVELLDETEALQILTELSVPQAMRNWYVSNVFLPPM